MVHLKTEGGSAMTHTLYGDGIHDDYPAIQELINSGACEVTLPVPKKEYLITQTLVLPSNFRLVLPRFARIRLADDANCIMVRNRWVPSFAHRLAEDFTDVQKHLWYYVDDYAPDAPCENIEICGGIWDFSNMHQLPNFLVTGQIGPRGCTGSGMTFYNVKNLKLSNMTLKDPVNFAISLDRVTWFTVENIDFDFNKGNPYQLNMDGVHLNGNCHYGVIRNLKGACYDDTVAINAHEGSRGPITNIEIDGIFAEGAHSAVRLLTVCNDVENIHISNVYGSYYQYCIGITKYYPGQTSGVFRNITLEKVAACKAPRPWVKGYVYPLLYVQAETKVQNLVIRDVHRRETLNPVETIHVGENTDVDSLILDHIVTENHTGSSMPLLANAGTIRRLTLRDVFPGADPLLTGSGAIIQTV